MKEVGPQSCVSDLELCRLREKRHLQQEAGLGHRERMRFVSAEEEEVTLGQPVAISYGQLERRDWNRGELQRLERESKREREKG